MTGGLWVKKLIKLYVIITLWTIGLFAQSRVDTENFIIREIKTFENDNFTVKDVSFSGGGSVFNFTTYVPNNSDDRMTFALGNVNIYPAMKLTSNGLYRYDLVVETRGRNCKIRMNGGEVTGAIPMLRDVANKKVVDSLVKAFTHLKKLIGTEDSRSPF